MRIAVLSDIHGNLPAFEAALAHVRRQGVDRLVIAGDLINGAPDSRACWDLAQTLDCVILRGNHERYVYDFDSPTAPPLWHSERFAPVRWTVAQFSAEERRLLAGLPLTYRLPDTPNLLITHASPQRDNDSVQPYTPEEILAQFFAEVEERMIVRGHDHWSMVRLWDGRTVVTAGSVGMTLDEHPTARYVLLEHKGKDWHFCHHAVPYDVDAVVERFHSSGYLDEAGPMARLLLREIATASPHIVPFLRLYERWEQQGAISLAAAVERYFRVF
ncbi:MAG: metallophosphoesterase [Chloroflexi bacterium]|nr:MAG: metallophosphoesterase [Chloroflexota bacterium]